MLPVCYQGIIGYEITNHCAHGIAYHQSAAKELFILVNGVKSVDYHRYSKKSHYKQIEELSQANTCANIAYAS